MLKSNTFSRQVCVKMFVCLGSQLLKQKTKKTQKKNSSYIRNAMLLLTFLAVSCLIFIGIGAEDIVVDELVEEMDATDGDGAGTDGAEREVEIEILEPVNGCELDERAAPGFEVFFHYVGSLLDGTEFDNSYERGAPLNFVLGAGRVIPGWEQGVVGMCKGEKRRLVIPPELGYGERGAGDVIPPDATLNFEVELVDVNPNPVVNTEGAPGSSTTDIVVLALMVITSVGGAWAFHLANKKKPRAKAGQPPKKLLKKFK